MFITMGIVDKFSVQSDQNRYDDLLKVTFESNMEIHCFQGKSRIYHIISFRKVTSWNHIQIEKLLSSAIPSKPVLFC